MPKQKPTALIFIHRVGSPDPSVDLEQTLALADELQVHVLRCYVVGPMRPNAFQDLMNDVRSHRVAMVIIPQVEPSRDDGCARRLDTIRAECTVLAADTGNVYPRFGLALATAVSAGSVRCVHER
ncbi:hypothetical protein [Nocardia sp. NPDC047038]|uniref:hypothetical protein n=1 Tax=Nocardia sp. NPDC047038 TaxID=3154338 RepID=UPI0033FA3948